MCADAEELLDTVQQLADWLSDVLVGGKDISEGLRVHDSDQHGEIDPPVDAMDRSDSLALLLKNAINLISTVLNGTEAQVTVCQFPKYPSVFNCQDLDSRSCSASYGVFHSIAHAWHRLLTVQHLKSWGFPAPVQLA